MVQMRLVYGVARYWRCYFLLLVASVLSFFLIYVSKNDPNLEYYFPYFRLGSNYYNFYASGGAEKIKKLMEANYLDYEFLSSNSRFCINKLKIDEDYAILNEYQDPLSSKEIKTGNTNQQIEYLFLVVSQALNFKYRMATRATWAKNLEKMNSKLVFAIGNPTFKNNREKLSLVQEIENENKFTQLDKLKLEQEISEKKDIIQINMPDHENYTSTKTLISIRWALTYCSMAKNLFILSDSAVLNSKKFIQVISNKSVINKNLNDSVILGQCDYTDEKFALALKLFFNDLYKKEKNNLTQNLTEPESQSKSGKNALKIENYKGQYCSNLGWIMTINGAKRLWITALRSPYMMKISPAYLNGYLAFKSNLKLSNLFEYQDVIPKETNCLNVFEKNPDYLLCAENFTINSRYSSYIATWNSPIQGPLVFSKLK